MGADLEYAVDGGDQLIFLGDQWLEFAFENGAPELTPEAILGRPIWQFISDAETRSLYSVMFAQVRATSQCITVPFRCDSPRRRRFLEMRLSPGGGGVIRLATRQLGQEEREREVALVAGLPGRGELVTSCSWCKRVKLSDDTWVDVEAAAGRLGLFTRAPLLQLTHGICPSCYRELHRQLEEEQR